MSDHDAEYRLCRAISGRCGCAERNQRPCEAIETMVENGEGPAEEASRLSWEANKARIESENG